MAPPEQVIPARLHLEDGRIVADWVDVAGSDPTLPFLSDRIARSGPGWRAPLPAAGGVVDPAALILHAGRSGSTLVSRALSRLSRCHVLSEPQALNDLLGVDGVWPFQSPTQRRAALRQVVDALTRSARPDQDRVILKLSSWNALHLPLLEEAFPAVPKLFVYRSPEEVLMSLSDEPAGWMRRAGDRMQSRLFLRTDPAPAADKPLAFAAQVLGRSLSAVADSIERSTRPEEWLLTPYDTLPGALNARILPWLGLVPPASEAEVLTQSLGAHAKDPAGRRPFAPDSARKQAAVTPALADLVHTLVSAPYERLEGLRLRKALGTG